MVKKLILSVPLMIIVLLFAPAATVLAEDSRPSATEVAYEKVNPIDGFSYTTKRLGEKVKLALFSISANSKEEFYKELSSRRLAELKYVIEKKDLDNFEKATIRYYTSVGEWTEFILDKKLVNKKEPAVKVLQGHLPLLDKLMEGYDGTTAEWRFIKHDADYVNIYISKLQN